VKMPRRMSDCGRDIVVAKSQKRRLEDLYTPDSFALHCLMLFTLSHTKPIIAKCSVTYS
jgi:hypothetical protein